MTIAVTSSLAFYIGYMETKIHFIRSNNSCSNLEVGGMIVFIFDQGFKKLVSSFKQLLFELKSRGNESIHLQSRIQKATFFARTIIIRTRKFRVPMKILISKHI